MFRLSNLGFHWWTKMFLVHGFNIVSLQNRELTSWSNQYLADINSWQRGWDQLPYAALKRGGKYDVLYASVVSS